MSLNNRLIEAIAEHAETNKNIATLLSDILSIGKEAVYRRLRNEVPFSFREAGKIALALNMSLDQLISLESKDRSVFELQFIDSEDFFEYYSRYFQYYIDFFTRVESYPNSRMMLVHNTLPASCIINYDHLFRFTIYKKFYQLQSSPSLLRYAELEIPAALTQQRHRVSHQVRKMQETYFIVDWTVFPSYVRDVQYFYRLGLITTEELEQIQSDLFTAIADLEEFTVSGSFPNGNKVFVYLSNIDFISSHVYVEYGEHLFIQQILFSMNMIVSRDPELCMKQKSWIDILIKYSTLITQSGEIERVKYFNNQRECIANMTNPEIGN